MREDLDLEFILVPSSEKVRPSVRPRSNAVRVLDLFKNDRVSFQLAYTLASFDEEQGIPYEEYRLELDGGCLELAARDVALVPCAYLTTGVDDEYYMAKESGLYPDRLEPSDGTIRPVYGLWRSVWIDVSSTGHVKPGPARVVVKVVGREGDVIFSDCVDVVFHDMELPQQAVHHTEWLHADCLADYYKVEVFSEEHWMIIEDFITFAHDECACDMIYTPVFTPALDTEIGGERTTVQLVGISEVDGCYVFDFSRLRRWCSILRRHDVSNVEVCHLFTQWGAHCAPKVIVNGVRRFGWDTEAVDPGYIRLLRCLIPQLRQVLEEEGFQNEHVWFHISDEPKEDDLASYKAARDAVSDLLEGCNVFDALSNYKLYSDGIVRQPVVAADHIDGFIAKAASPLWVYYCVGQGRLMPNRFIGMQPYRTRVMGLLMYYHGISGFLQWGFNFYNSRRSAAHINPYLVTDGLMAFPSGDAFLVYPGPDGRPLSSLRAEYVRQSFRDHRLLQALEGKLGRDAVLDLIGSVCGGRIGFADYPQCQEFVDDVMAEVIRLLCAEE